MCEEDHANELTGIKKKEKKKDREKLKCNVKMCFESIRPSCGFY